MATHSEVQSSTKLGNTTADKLDQQDSRRTDRGFRNLLARFTPSARLFRTSAFRIALIYVTLFGALSAATFAFIYWSTRDQIESQVDTRLRLETDYLINLYKSGAVEELLEAIQRRNQIDTYERFYSLTRGSPTVVDSEEGPVLLKAERTTSTRNMGDVVDLAPGSPRRFLPVRVAELKLSDGLTLTIGHTISDEKALIDRTFVLVSIATFLTLIFSLIGGIWIGTAVLRRIDSISTTASEIMNGDLSQRLRVTARDDEFDEIASKLNQMLNRIEDLMASMQQVTNNVAHDLRSPLTRLRNRLEVTLLEERDPENYRAVMDEAIGDADTLIHTFNAMLSIARLEIFHCNKHLIGQAVTNLLDNAIKYTPKPGKVTLKLESNETSFEIRVSDDGPGIGAEDRERVLERFVRLENERNSPGNGLGLSLVHAVTRIHGGELLMADNIDDNGGLLATLRFNLESSPGRITSTTPATSEQIQ